MSTRDGLLLEEATNRQRKLDIVSDITLDHKHIYGYIDVPYEGYEFYHHKADKNYLGKYDMAFNYCPICGMRL